MKKQQFVFWPGRSLGNFPNFLARVLHDTQQPIRVTVETHRQPKTLAQNSYFHGVVVPTIANEKGILAWKVRESLKQAFLPQTESVIEPGSYHTTSIADLSRDQYSEFIEECLAWAAGEGIYVPGPDEVGARAA